MVPELWSNCGSQNLWTGQGEESTVEEMDRDKVVRAADADRSAAICDLYSNSLRLSQPCSDFLSTCVHSITLRHFCLSLCPSICLCFCLHHSRYIPMHLSLSLCHPLGHLSRYCLSLGLRVCSAGLRDCCPTSRTAMHSTKPG